MALKSGATAPFKIKTISYKLVDFLVNDYFLYTKQSDSAR